MDAMYSAIKGRRGGLLNDSEENADQMTDEKPSKGGVDIKSLVSVLSEDQKMQLLKMLVSGSKDSEQAPTKMNAQSIEKGGMGPGEEEELEEATNLGGEHESEDEIAESLLSSGDKYRAERGDNPRNLGERMKFGLASKLKNKKG